MLAKYDVHIKTIEQRLPVASPTSRMTATEYGVATFTVGLRSTGVAARPFAEMGWKPREHCRTRGCSHLLHGNQLRSIIGKPWIPRTAAKLS